MARSDIRWERGLVGTCAAITPPQPYARNARNYGQMQFGEQLECEDEIRNCHNSRDVLQHNRLGHKPIPV